MDAALFTPTLTFTYQASRFCSGRGRQWPGSAASAYAAGGEPFHAMISGNDHAERHERQAKAMWSTTATLALQAHFS